MGNFEQHHTWALYANLLNIFPLIVYVCYTNAKRMKISDMSSQNDTI